MRRARLISIVSAYLAIPIVWAWIIYLIVFVPGASKLWVKAGEGLSLFQRHRMGSSEWLQDGFNLIWTFWTLAFLTFVWLYLRHGRPGGPEEVPVAPAKMAAPSPTRKKKRGRKS